MTRQHAHGSRRVDVLAALSLTTCFLFLLSISLFRYSHLNDGPKVLSSLA